MTGLLRHFRQKVRGSILTQDCTLRDTTVRARSDAQPESNRAASA